MFVYIYWKGDDLWYRAQIIKFHDTSLKFTVRYYDNDVSRIDLQRELFFVDEETYKDQTSVTAEGKKKRGRKPKAYKVMQAMKSC